MNYVYIRSEPNLWTVGFYTPDGKWEPETDHSTPEDAAKRAAWLNGGQDSKVNEALAMAFEYACAENKNQELIDRLDEVLSRRMDS